ncbi:MAG TPA: rhodanese-like domain-containing protein [Thermodesulfovibrionales bacterium]|nr:rhodanese-like domain-containing protein [Thermodesulfovibrionales bacterium]
MNNFRKLFCLLFVLVASLSLVSGCGSSSSSSGRSASFSLKALKAFVDSGSTAAGASDRVLVVDVRQSSNYISGHVKDSLSVPLSMISKNGMPIYTNGYDQLNTTASTALKDSWLTHLLVNQLVNDFVGTYETSRIVFYGTTMDEGRQAAELANKIGYKNVYYMFGDFQSWEKAYPAYTERYYAGVESVDLFEASFVMTGFINNTNFENVSQYGTHHCIIFKGGALHDNGILQVNMAPLGFQELLTFLGADPAGNMADGIFFGDASIWGSKFTNGQKVEYSVTWDNAGRYYSMQELFEERPSLYQPEPLSFESVGFEAHVGGTRESNLNWNPGCIFCFYSCVCGITSNSKANENTWDADGGIYNEDYADLRNYYAGRYYPKMNILPGKGQSVKIKVRVVH